MHVVYAMHVAHVVHVRPTRVSVHGVCAQGDEDQRRAMMKSFVESNGTVLSTNWSEVGGGEGGGG